MSKKFNPKIYLNKQRIYQPIAGHSGISRLYIWNSKKLRYEPSKGNSYLARRYELKPDGSQKRVAKFFASLNEAKFWKSFFSSIRTPITPSCFSQKLPVPRNDTGYTFLDLIEDFKKHRFSLLRRGSQLNYLKHFPLYAFFYGIEVESINPKTIDEWLVFLKSDLSKYKKTRTSFLKEMASLKAILNWYIDRSDDTRLVLPIKKRHREAAVIRKTAKKTRFMLPNECELWFKTLKKTSPSFFAPAFTQVNLILRVSEVFAMKWENYNEREGVYRVCEYTIWDRVKGSQPRIEAGAKNMEEGDFYDVPLRESVIELFNALKANAESELIFHNNGNIWSYRQIQNAYDRAFKAAGLPFSGTHVCRHTGATDFLNTTGDPLALQQMGNWSDQHMAMHYGKVLKSRAKEAIKKADLETKKKNLKLIVNS